MSLSDSCAPNQEIAKPPGPGIERLCGGPEGPGLVPSFHLNVSKPYQNPISNTDWSCRSSEEQIPQVVENLESGGKPKEALERVAMRPRQVRIAWEEVILATPGSLLSRSVGSLQPG